MDVPGPDDWPIFAAVHHTSVTIEPQVCFMFAWAVAGDAAYLKDGFNPRTIKGAWSGIGRCCSLRQSKSVTQPARHVLGEVIFAERQLPTAVARPSHQTNPGRKHNSVDKS